VFDSLEVSGFGVGLLEARKGTAKEARKAVSEGKEDGKGRRREAKGELVELTT